MPPQHSHRHPFFARFYTRFAPIAERRGADEHRRTLLAGLSGHVIEIGPGPGPNFAHYAPSVTEVVAIEPEPYLRMQAQRTAATAPVKVTVLDGHAGELPVPDASFDAGVAALVLCTVPDQARALAELQRVIRPGGELRFYEHVVGSSTWEARVQRALDATFWPHLAGGCHLARDTAAEIERAGFVIESCERFMFKPSALLPPDPHILGSARRL